MSRFSENIPILYGRDLVGNLQHIDSVANGEACGCFCPCPSCDQPLIARNKGTKRIHHFAHKRGTCAWSVEYIISVLIADILQMRHCMSFPELNYYDKINGRAVVISPAKTLEVASATTKELSGRGAPEVMLTCRSNSILRQFVLVISLVHPISSVQLEYLKFSALDVIVVDLRALLSRKKMEQGKHFDRANVLAGFQDASLIADVLNNETGFCKKWLINAKRDAAEQRNREDFTKWLKEEEKRRVAEAKERKRKCIQYEAERAEEQARKQQEAEKERVEEEKHRKERAEHDMARIAELINQQQTQARDSLGRRWVKCESCGEVKLESEFQSYGGRDRINLGCCSECFRKGRA